jgi:nicotinamide-nucleotide adenylyltransferase
MEKEILACIEDKNIKFLQAGQIAKYVYPLERNEAHKNKVSHLIIRFFIMALNPEGEVFYLVQRRGKNKKTYPNFFTDSASGHVIYQKNMSLEYIRKNAFRELEEELGIPEKAIKKSTFYDLSTEKDDQTTEIAYIFFGLVDFNVKLKLNAKEVVIEGSRFYSKTELVEILRNENTVDYSKKIWEYLLEKDVNAIFQRKKLVKYDKKDTTALFIGRFQPLHHGHIYVVYRILENFKLLKIGIGSSQTSNTINDPFTNEERKRFIQAALAKRKISNYEIFDIPDIFDAKKWPDHVISIVGNVDVIFSNSDWVRELFQDEGYKLGKKLTIFKNKYNATNVRKLIEKNDKRWRKLVPKEIAELIQKFHGIERIQSLYK